MHWSRYLSAVLSFLWCVEAFNIKAFNRGFATGSVASGKFRDEKQSFVSLKSRPKPNPIVVTAKDQTSEIKKNWEFSRFASTFTFFNGNPLARILPFINSKSSVPRPTTQKINSKEIILWDFAKLTQVFTLVYLFRSDRTG